MQNRLIIAIFLIADGITFILNPNNSLAQMARSIIILVLLAAFSTLIANLTAKTKNKKSIIISIIILILGILLYIYPDLVSAYIQLILSFIIIGDGLINLLNAFNLEKYSKSLAKKINKSLNKDADKQNDESNDINKSLNEGMEQQKKKLIVPLKNLVDKTNKTSFVYILINIISIILGIMLIIFPNVSMVVWGVIFLYTGFSDLFASMKSMNISKKIKEKKFKEILYDEDEK